MTIEDFLKKYKGVKVQFVSYYKYKFTYETIKNNKKITVVFGDPTNDIYRSSFLLVKKISKYGLVDFEITQI